MKFLSPVGQRLIYAIILVLAVIVLNFLLVHLAPGDPADVIAGEMGGATQEILDDIRRGFGLDKPLPTQLWIYLTRVVSGDLGMSYYYNQPVVDLILERLWPTLLLVVTALFFAIVLGTLLGFWRRASPTAPSATSSPCCR